MKTFDTIRAVALNQCYRFAASVGTQFYMSTHFQERINLRSPNQNATFLNLVRAIKFIVERQPEFSKRLPNGKHPVISVEIGAEYFFCKIDHSQLTCMTYFFNVESRHTVVADRRFRLKELKDAEVSTT